MYLYTHSCVTKGCYINICMQLCKEPCTLLVLTHMYVHSIPHTKFSVIDCTILQYYSYAIESRLHNTSIWLCNRSSIYLYIRTYIIYVWWCTGAWNKAPLTWGYSGHIDTSTVFKGQCPLIPLLPYPMATIHSSNELCNASSWWCNVDWCYISYVTPANICCYSDVITVSWYTVCWGWWLHNNMIWLCNC